MYDKLIHFLEKNTSEDKYQPILRALRAIELHGDVSAIGEIGRMLETSNDSDVGTILNDINTIVHAGMDRILAAHHVTCEYDTRVRTHILEGLQLLSNYDDAETIARMCEDDADPLQTLADLLEMVTELSWSDYSDCLLSVNASLINRLFNMYEPKTDDDAFVLDIDPRRKESIQRFMSVHLFSMARNAVIDDLTPFGLAFDMLKDRYQASLSELEPKAPRQAAIELVGLALISDVGTTDFVRQTKDRIEHVYSDINFITEVSVAMDDVIREVMGHG